MNRHPDRTTARSIGAAAAALAIVLTGLVASPAQALTWTMQCNADPDGTVELTRDDVDYRLTGPCDRVHVRADHVTVTMSSAQRLTVRGEGNVIDSDNLARLNVSGRDQRITPSAVKVAVVRGRDVRVRAEGLLERVRVHARHALVTGREAHRLSIEGRHNTARLDKLWDLVIDGRANTVRAGRLGDTSVRGPRNTVRWGSRF